MSKLLSTALLLLLLFSFNSFGQKKTLQAKSTTENITIDGKNKRGNLEIRLDCFGFYHVCT